MEPVTVAAITLIILRDKTFEKTSEIIVNKAFEQCGKVIRLLNGKSPDTEKAIKAAQEKLTLPSKEQKDISEAVVLIEKVKSVANVNPEVKTALEALASYVEEAAKTNSELAAAITELMEAVKAQSSNSQSKAKIAERIGIYSQKNQGGEFYQTFGEGGITIHNH